MIDDSKNCQISLFLPKVQVCPSFTCLEPRKLISNIIRYNILRRSLVLVLFVWLLLLVSTHFLSSLLIIAAVVLLPPLSLLLLRSLLLLQKSVELSCCIATLVPGHQHVRESSVEFWTGESGKLTELLTGCWLLRL